MMAIPSLPVSREWVQAHAARWDPQGAWTPARLESLQRAVQHLLAFSGGVLCEDVPVTPEQRAAFLDEALVNGLHKALRVLFPAPSSAGGVAIPLAGDAGLPALQPHRYAPPLDLNAASQQELEALPALGPKLARRVLAVREQRLGFDAVEDLAAVSGIGKKGVEALRPFVAVRPAGQPPRPLPPPVAALHARPSVHALAWLLRAEPEEWRPGFASGGPEDELVGFVWWAARLARTDPHPVISLEFPELGSQVLARQRRRALLTEAEGAETRSAAGIAPLGTRYYPTVQALLDGARTSVDVVMFFASLDASPRHPVRPLLDALVRAAQAGKAVRVLLDRDAETDVYGSRVINPAAYELLRSGGVQVRYDAPDRLTHSKLVIVDGRWVVVGSHNWTAGSFFNYVDYSVLADSPGLAAWYAGRFGELWANAGA
jgi:hypothetical protein